jgi:hypothetical protein
MMLKLHEWSHEIWSKNVIFKCKNYVPHILFHVQIVVFRNSFFRHFNKALACLKKWWVESDFKASNLPLSLRLRVSSCHYNIIYNNAWTKQVKQLSKQYQTMNPKLVCMRYLFEMIKALLKWRKNELRKTTIW